MNQFKTQESNGLTLSADQRLENLRQSWRWLVIIGLIITICGAFSAVFLIASSVAAMIFLGTLLFVGGVMQVVSAFYVTAIKPLFWGWLISGLLFLLACFFAFAWPYEALIAITLLIALSLGASGVVRLFSGLQNRGVRGWLWLVISGFIGVFAAIIIALNLQVLSLFLPGLLLALDLLFHGLSMVMFGITLKKSIV